MLLYKMRNPCVILVLLFKYLFLSLDLSFFFFSTLVISMVFLCTSVTLCWYLMRSTNSHVVVWCFCVISLLLLISDRKPLLLYFLLCFCFCSKPFSFLCTMLFYNFLVDILWGTTLILIFFLWFCGWIASNFIDPCQPDDTKSGS